MASRKHAAHVSEDAIERFLGLAEDGHAGEEALAEARRSAAREEAERVADSVAAQAPARAGARGGDPRARARAPAAVGYGGDYRAWLEKVTPPDLE